MVVQGHGRLTDWRGWFAVLFLGFTSCRLLARAVCRCVAIAPVPVVSIFAGRVFLFFLLMSFSLWCQGRVACVHSVVAFRTKLICLILRFKRPGSALYRQKPTHHNTCTNQNGQLSPRHTSPFAVDRRTTDVGATSPTPAGQSAGVARGLRRAYFHSFHFFRQRQQEASRCAPASHTRHILSHNSS